ncbi:hypothetical protein [Arenibaculum pallidiluteum]|uniref:hypothetical protein n=1 Tax=Arenibaculum pallidiluteum TaxID=2812559 RepID=UPI001A969938|nr:hypothetical protein [Arenibaculum pallidiluteum]
MLKKEQNCLKADEAGFLLRTCGSPNFPPPAKGALLSVMARLLTTPPDAAIAPSDLSAFGKSLSQHLPSKEAELNTLLSRPWLIRAVISALVETGGNTYQAQLADILLEIIQRGSFRLFKRMLDSTLHETNYDARLIERCLRSLQNHNYFGTYLLVSDQVKSINLHADLLAYYQNRYTLIAGGGGDFVEHLEASWRTGDCLRNPALLVDCLRGARTYFTKARIAEILQDVPHSPFFHLPSVQQEYALNLYAQNKYEEALDVVQSMLPNADEAWARDLERLSEMLRHAIALTGTVHNGVARQAPRAPEPCTDTPPRPSGEILVVTSLPPAAPQAHRESLLRAGEAGFVACSLNSSAELGTGAPIDDAVFVHTCADTDAVGKRIYISTIERIAEKWGAGHTVIVNADIRVNWPALHERFHRNPQPADLVIYSREDVDASGSSHGIYGLGFDLFIARTEALRLFRGTEFAFGLPWWDYYFPIAALLNGFTVKRGSQPRIVHSDHAAKWDCRSMKQYAAEYAKHILLRQPGAQPRLPDKPQRSLDRLIDCCRYITLDRRSPSIETEWMHELLNSSLALLSELPQET